ncbi:hypothetical protein MaudCBS49596_001552 [Microsporum audouinii]
MAPEMPHQMRTPPPNTPPNTPEESLEPVVTSTMKIGSSQLSDGVAHQAHPDKGASASRQKLLSKAYRYLDQVRAQFIDQPDIYSTFLDILKDSKSRVIDIPYVVSRISKLFARYPSLIQGFNIFLPPEDQIECDSSNNPNTTYHCIARYETTPISPINPPEILATPLNTPTESSEPAAPSITYETSTPTSMLSEQLGTGKKTGYQIEYGAGNDPNTICVTDCPVANNALTPTQTAQGGGMNGVAPQQPDTAKDAGSFDSSTMMDPWSTSLPLPQMLAILVQPPELTRQKIELFPPIVVRLLQPGDMPNVCATATLLSNGVDVTDQLGGELIQSPIDGTFRFPGLTIYGQGVYHVRICLYRLDYDSCLQGVTQVGCVDSNIIIIGP